MAETKSGTSPSHPSKGGAGDFTKRVQRKFSRAQERVLQKFGRSEETVDVQFETCVQNLQEQQNDGQRIYKDLKAYLNAVRVMRDASGRLFQSLFDVYELEWEGGEDLGAVVEGEDLLWNDYEAKLRDQALLTIESYMSQFPDMRERIAKRGRKLVDYDITRHQLESLQNAKKRDDIKINKAEDEVKFTKKIFEDLNRELKGELPPLYDSRIGCYITVFQAISNLREIFYQEMSLNNKDLQNIMMNLKAQHPDKSFVVKNFNRGTLKRRSLKDALSPRSLRASFSELHMSYSSRGTLRREHTPSFRSGKSPYEPSSQEVLASPTRPKPPRNISYGETDTIFRSEDNPEVERKPSTISAPAMVDSKAPESVHTYSLTDKNANQENEGTETKEKEPLLSPEKDGVSLEIKNDSSPEACDKNELDLNINQSEKVNSVVLSIVEDPKEHSTQPEELSQPHSVRVAGVAINSNIVNKEEPGVSSKENATNNQIFDEMKEETF
ncbi:bridging integrator 2a [Clarias gariepinus]